MTGDLGTIIGDLFATAFAIQSSRDASASYPDTCPVGSASATPKETSDVQASSISEETSLNDSIQALTLLLCSKHYGKMFAMTG